MDVRKYESFSMQDALKRVKSELGKDAVILATREYDMGSSTSASKKKMYEITAAPAVQSRSTSSSSSSSQRKPIIGQKQVEKVEFPRLKREDAHFIPEKPLFLKPTLPNLQKADAPVRVESHAPEYSILIQELARVRKDIEALPQLDIVEQMQEIKVILHELIKEKYKKTYAETNTHITNLNIKLRTAGVQESLIAAATSYLETVEDKPDHDPDVRRELYLNHMVRFLIKQISVKSKFEEVEGQKISCFIGPTGVGKTTTLAKIASKLKADKKAPILLLSLDTFKVGGAEQLRTFSRILDCKFYEVSDLEDLPQILSQNSHCPYVLIDTAGQHVRDLEYLQLLKKLKELPLPIEFDIVLSSIMKQRDIDETIRGYRFLSPESLLFTKLDESWSFGEILNSCVQSRIPLSYFATGQNVPEDIEVATKERVIERILKI